MSLLKEAVEMLTEARTFDQEGVEIIPQSKRTTAAKMANELVQHAEKKSGSGTPEGAEVLAKQMAAAFHQALVKEIEDVIKMKSMKRYTHYGEAGTFHRTA